MNVCCRCRIWEPDQPIAEMFRRKVSQIAVSIVCSQKFGRLLFRLANFYRARTIIEMGSSLGISTAYLASADPTSRIITIEGSPAIAGIATRNISKIKASEYHTGNRKIWKKLGPVIASQPPADLVFIDGNHRKNAVLDYFEQFMEKHSSLLSVIIIHDIHWSREMEEAWDILQEHPMVNMSIDIFSAGLIFFRDEFRVKQKFTIRF